MAKAKSTTRKKSAPAKKTTRTAPPPEPAEREPRPSHAREWTGAIFAVLAFLLLLSYFNAEGSVLSHIKVLFEGLLGWGYWLLAPAFAFAAVVLFLHHGRPVEYRVVCLLLLPLLFSALAHALLGAPRDELLSFREYADQLFRDGQDGLSGGVLGGLIGGSLVQLISMAGTVILTGIAFLVAFVLGVRGSFSGMLQPRPRAEKPAPAESETVKTVEAAAAPAKKPVVIQNAVEPARPQSAPRKPQSAAEMDIPLGPDEEELPLAGLKDLLGDSYSAPVKPRRATAKKKPDPSVPSKPDVTKEDKIREELPLDLEDSFRPLEVSKTPAAPAKSARKPIAVAAVSDPPKQEVLPRLEKPETKKQKREEVAAQAKAVENAVASADEHPEYAFPPTELLRAGSGVVSDARDEIALNKERLEGAIHSFGINADVVAITRGPTVTRYDIELEQGVKLARVTNLAGDLALALGVVNVRIAPIPDKISTVGIEVPNKLVSTVYLRDIIESPRFQNAKSRLSFAIGKDIGGECIVGNIAKLPHMLIAGTTGSGKSVCMNSLILSLLYKARPDEVRLIMIDPKMVELGIYNGIPHLYVPVVTDPKKAAGALQWSVVEMLKRYRLFSEVGVRDIDSYNKHCQSTGESTIPKVVIVIDELADLMLVASKEVEESICRVAQMGRAAGMHLIIATQRPSADVITGLMKANIPSRIAFAVSSAMESRIILDQGGAEKLIGMGDMLFSPVGSGKPTRIQGAFVSDEQREEVIQFIKESASASGENEDIVAFMNKASEDSKGGSDSGKGGGKEEPASESGYDEMLPQAVECVLESGSCSVSMLQRRVKLGYSRAARIVDQMEELGVVGPYEGAKPRSVVIDRAGWQQLQVQLGLASADDLGLAAELSDAADSEAEE